MAQESEKAAVHNRSLIHLESPFTTVAQ